MSDRRGRHRGPAAILPVDDEIVLGLDAQGGAAYFWRDEYRTHLGRPPVYNPKHLNVVTILPPGERGAPRAAATTCVSDAKVALDTAAALGLAVAGPTLWTFYPRDHARGGRFKVLVDIAGGWRFPTPLRRLLPVPKQGEVLVAIKDAGSFYALADDQKRVVVVVLSLDGQELQARISTLPGGPFLRWDLTDCARDAGFDSQFIPFNRVIGREAEAVAEYLADVAGRGLFTFPRRSMRRDRIMHRARST
jgi:hypothetical protein